jgi:hypothetical protein
MKKYKFTILKHTLVNGSSYYICSVKRVYPLVWTWDGIVCFLSNYRNNDKYLNEYGSAYWNDKTKFKSREYLLENINKYMKFREDEDGERVTSVETEIIWK